MYTPRLAFNRVGNIGQKLPDPYRVFGREQINFRRGATAMIAGVPGAFKSVLALNMVKHWADQGVSTMYFSADGDEFTVVRRLAGIITGDDSDVVESNMTRRDVDRYEQALASLEGVEFEYEQFEFEELVIRVKQYEAIYGAYPDVIVIDNLIDFASNPYAWDEMQAFIKNLDGLVKETKAHGLILHHAKLPDRNPNARNPLPLGDAPPNHMIQGRMTQFPTVAITLGADGLNLRAACVKNRNGRQDPDASKQIGFTVMPNMQVVEA